MNNQNTNSNELRVGEMTFVQHHRPPLKAAEYCISIVQRVDFTGPPEKASQYRSGVERYADASKKEGQPVHEVFKSVNRFFVRGERFRLDPSEVYAVFPPANQQGEFAESLPHIVLNRPTLPWERSTRKDSQDATPWLALLLFDEDDPPPELKQITLQELLNSPAGTFFPSDIRLYDGESLEDGCAVVDVPVNLFEAIAPSMEDLTWLAHARKVRMENKEEPQANPANAVPLAGRAPGQNESDRPIDVNNLAVVVGSRLPRAGKWSTVHLVSLEGLGDYLPRSDGNQNANLPEGTTSIRLISLKVWRFMAVKGEQSFQDILQKLDVKPATLRLPDPFGNAAGPTVSETVETALSMGYTAMNHVTRHGDKTASWYRGPLVPFDVPPRAIDLPLPVADAATRYDSDTGLFDVSYAAAWQLGRLLAIQNQEFSMTLYNWKIAKTVKTIASIEKQNLQQHLGSDAQTPESLQDKATNFFKKFESRLTAAKAPEASTGKPLQPRKKLFNRLADELKDPQLIAAKHQEEPVKTKEHSQREVISLWLGRLKLLYGVPFNYLVPDERMLPDKCLRFFYVDQNWIDCLVDGAYSIGRSTSHEIAQDKAFMNDLQAGAAKAARQIRNSGHGVQGTDHDAVKKMTGFLLHSDVVQGWPGLEVQVSGIDDRPLPILRMERLADDVLFCLFDGTVQQVELHQPPEGVHFGVDPGVEEETYIKSLKFLKPVDDHAAGETVEMIDPIGVQFRDKARRVIAINKLAGDLKNALEDESINTSTVVQTDPFTTAEFALEMVEGVQSVYFAIH